MSEQFGIDRSFGNGAAVHGDIFIVFTCRIGMDHLREKLLADAAFTRNEYRKIGRRHTQGNLQRTVERLGVTDDPETVLLYQSCFTANTGKLFLSRIRNGLHTPVRSGSHGLRHGRCELFEVFALQTLDLRPA